MLTNTPSRVRDRSRGKALLACGLAALVATSAATGQSADSDALRRLQEENAALRKQLAAAQGQSPAAPANTTAPAAPTSSPSTSSSSSVTTRSSLATDEGVQTLSAFEVSTEKDYGYLKTNAVTATRIGAEIQDVPMAISVMSEEFISDLGLKTVNDVLRFSASGAADGSFVMSRPANSATPQGRFTMRGFPMNSLLRNGIFRYVGHNLDNVDRVEIVKGPAAVFFGAGYPGGVINYVTKKPQFGKIPTTFEYSIDEYGGEKIKYDQNTVFSKKVAFRLNTAWSDLNGDLKYEYDKYFSITPSITIIPFENTDLKVNLEFEHLHRKQQESAWVDRNPQAYYDSYANPSAEQIATANSVYGVAKTAQGYRDYIFASAGRWINIERARTGDAYLPQIREISRGAKYLDANGNLITDEDFNFTNRGSYIENNIDSFQATVDYSTGDWLKLRYTYTGDNARFDGQEGRIEPNADRQTFNAAVAGAMPGYYLESDTNQLDVIFDFDVLGINNTLLVGGSRTENFQRYDDAGSTPIYWQIPGYNTPTVQNSGPTLTTGVNVPATQYLTDRNGNILSAQNVYAMWDPGIHTEPPIDKLYPVSRNVLDGYPTTNNALYANWQGKILDDKVTLMAGYRYENREQDGQWLTANFPWFSNPGDAYLNQDKYDPGVYNYSPSYAGDASNFNTLEDNSWMAGISYAITPDISVYATVSKTFLLNSGLQGGYTTLSINDLINAALAANPGGYDYYGHRITSLQEGLDALEAEGANENLKNEEGLNYEIGLKTSLQDGRITSTISVFHATRENQKIDNSDKQRNDPYNYENGATLFGIGTQFGGTSASGTRNFRWRTVGIKNEIEGTEAEVIWTPIRNYQTLINGSWLWTAKTVENPLIAKDDSEGSRLYYGNRIENVPEFRFNMVHKYSFTEGALAGLGLNANMRYSSETILDRSAAWNPDKGGFHPDAFAVFGAGVSYDWELLGAGVTSTLRVDNLFDKYYFENNYIPSDGRTITLATRITF